VAASLKRLAAEGSAERELYRELAAEEREHAASGHLEADVETKVAERFADDEIEHACAGV